jgi:hypothetical protein
VTALAIIALAIGWALAAVLAVVLVALAAVSFLPLHVSARTETALTGDLLEENLTGTVRWAARFRWGWLLLMGQVAGEGRVIHLAEVRLLGFRLHGKPGRRRERRSRPNLECDLLRAPIREAVRFARRVWKALGVRLHGNLVYGFSDPVLTGTCEAVLAATGRPRGVRLQPDFLDPGLNGWVRADGRIFGFQVLAAAWAGLRNPVLRRHLKQRLKTRLQRSRRAGAPAPTRPEAAAGTGASP